MEINEQYRGARDTALSGRIGARLRRWVEDVGAALAGAARWQGVAVDDGDLTTPDGLTARSSTLQQGERISLPAPEEQVWVIVRGRLRLSTLRGTMTVTTGEIVHIPENSPGDVTAEAATTYVSVSLPLM